MIPGDAYPKAPQVTANDGWVFTGWEPAYKLTGTVGAIAKSETRIFTAQYEEDANGNGIPDSQEPDEPDTPITPSNPTNPTTPSNPTTPATDGTTTNNAARTATTQTNAAANQNEYNLTEIDNGADNNADGTTTIDEDKTPLGNKVLDDTSAEAQEGHCILHFIILLITLLVAIIFILDGAKRRKRIDEMQNEIEKLR